MQPATKERDPGQPWHLAVTADVIEPRRIEATAPFTVKEM
jgi:hypothetical protein